MRGGSLLLNAIEESLRLCRVRLLQTSALHDKLVLCEAIGALGSAMESVSSAAQPSTTPSLSHHANVGGQDLSETMERCSDAIRTHSARASRELRRAAAILRLVRLPAVQETVVPGTPARPMYTAKTAVPGDVLQALECQIFDIEVSAAEVCALMPVRFPDIPVHFDICLANQCAEEGRHAALLFDQFCALGGKLGQVAQDLTIWNRVALASTLEEAVCIEHVLGEGYALGHDLMNASRYRSLGLNQLADACESLQCDELMHVRDALQFLHSINAPVDEIVLRFEDGCSAIPPPPAWFRRDLRDWVGFSMAQISRQFAKSEAAHASV